MLKRLLFISVSFFLLSFPGYAAGGTVEGVDSTVWVNLSADTVTVAVIPDQQRPRPIRPRFPKGREGSR